MTLVFAIIDVTGGASTANGETLTGAKLSHIASAVNVQLNRDVAPEYGGSYLVRVSDGNDVQPGEVSFWVRPALPLSPGAVALHTQGPMAEDAIAASLSLTGPGNSLSVAISHECIEIVGDEACDIWADRGDGVEVAHELCDPVESQTYMVGDVAVSNFVLRSFWQPDHVVGPWDFMSSRSIAGAMPPPGPMRVAPGGSGNYMIVRTAGDGIRQVTAMGVPNGRRPWRLGSRRARRGL